MQIITPAHHADPVSFICVVRLTADGIATRHFKIVATNLSEARRNAARKLTDGEVLVSVGMPGY